MTKKVALVTGASSGIGAAITTNLARDCAVAASSLNSSRLNAFVAELRQLKSDDLDDSIFAIPMDVRDSGSVMSAVDRVVERFGRIDILVNCAGIGGGGVTQDMSEDLWHQIIETNLSGTFRVTTAVLKASGMHQRGWGRVINIASTGGKQGVMYAAAYSASKHGVIGFTKSLGLELAKTGITVNAVCPGFVETPLAERARSNYARLWSCSIDEARRRIEARIPLGRYILPEEITGIVAYLGSDASNAVIAQAFNVCGGLGNY